jgi:ABC-2 type transport system permease protein
MYQVITIAVNDIRLLSRNWFGLFFIVGFPLIFAVFFGTVLGDIQLRTSMRIAVVDEDQSEGSREYIVRLRENAMLKIEEMSLTEAEHKVRRGQLATYVALRKGFGASEGLYFGHDQGTPLIELGFDPAHKADSALLQGILMEISLASMQRRFADPAKTRQLLVDAQRAASLNDNLKPATRQALQFMSMMNIDGSDASSILPSLVPKIARREVTQERVGPRSPYEIAFPSAIMWAMIGCVTSFSITIAAERLAGTLWRLRIAPLSLAHLLAGKGLACFLTCMTVTTFLLLLGYFAFGIRLAYPIELFVAMSCTSGCFVGIMMLLATLGKTEQGAAGAGWGILLPLTMIGGGMVPILFLPSWMQKAGIVSPIKWGIMAIEGAVWRGFTWREMLQPCAILLAIGCGCFFLGVRLLGRESASQN